MFLHSTFRLWVPGPQIALHCNKDNDGDGDDGDGDDGDGGGGGDVDDDDDGIQPKIATEDIATAYG